MAGYLNEIRFILFAIKKRIKIKGFNFMGAILDTIEILNQLCRQFYHNAGIWSVIKYSSQAKGGDSRSL